MQFYHVPWLFTLIAIFLYAIPLQVLGSKVVLWEFDNRGHSPRNNNNNSSNNNNVIKKEAENILKYKDLTIEIQRMWNVKTTVMPVIIGATGTI